MPEAKAYSARRRLLLLLGGLLIFALGLLPLDPETSLSASPTAPSPAVEIYARIDRQEITVAEIEKLAADELRALEQRRREILEAHVDEQIRLRLLAAEAEREGVDVDSYIQDRLAALSTEITDAEVESYRSAHGISEPLDQVAAQIRLRLAEEHLDAQLEATHQVERLID